MTLNERIIYGSFINRVQGMGKIEQPFANKVNWKSTRIYENVHNVIDNARSLTEESEDYVIEDSESITVCTIVWGPLMLQSIITRSQKG